MAAPNRRRNPPPRDHRTAAGLRPSWTGQPPPTLPLRFPRVSTAPLSKNRSSSGRRRVPVSCGARGTCAAVPPASALPPPPPCQASPRPPSPRSPKTTHTQLPAPGRIRKPPSLFCHRRRLTPPSGSGTPKPPNADTSAAAIANDKHFRFRPRPLPAGELPRAPPSGREVQPPLSRRHPLTS